MPWPRATEDRVRQLAMSRNLRMRGTHRRVQRADNYGQFRLIGADGNPVTPLLPLDRIEEFLTSVRGKWQRQAGSQIELPPYHQGEKIAVTP